MGYRSKALEAHDEKCRICGATERVVVHHRDGDRSNNDLENLVPVCRSCHNKIHARDSEVASFVRELGEVPRERDDTGSERITVTLPDDVDERLPYDEHDSKSATIVHYVEAGLEAEARIAELEDRLDSVAAERDDLRRQLQETTRRERELDEIVEYVETERELERERIEREREREAAPCGSARSGGCWVGTSTTPTSEPLRGSSATRVTPRSRSPSEPWGNVRRATVFIIGFAGVSGVFRPIPADPAIEPVRKRQELVVIIPKRTGRDGHSGGDERPRRRSIELESARRPASKGSRPRV